MAHKILVVDDEQEILAALDTHLSLIGYEIKTCDDPEEAFNLISIEKFHMVLLDINMPNMTGIELLKKIKSIKPTIQVIMITAYSTLEKAIDCWEAGASDYILKPFADLDAIGSIVNLTSERIRRWEDGAKKSIRK
jgi:two-component system response regulator HydG